MGESDVKRTVEAVWRIESARLIAGTARLVRDVGLAEDLAQEALVAALEQWPESGVPDNPGAWLVATAKHRGIDRLRRAEVDQRKTEELGRHAELRTREPRDLADAVDGARAVRGAGAARAPRAAGLGARGRLPDLQRGLLAHRG